MATEMTDALDTFLEGVQAKGHVWGENDCCLFPADWIVIQGHEDPALSYRGAYHDEAGAQTVIAGEGGFVVMAHKALTRVGWRRRRFSAAQRGDVGVLLLHSPHGPHPVGAVALGAGFWAMVTSKGLRMVKATALTSWTKP
ncbi:MAG: hypothetical protein EOP20_06855 [Hyphomicrobiales bacterium]|nr:MAG: hypothetical protein EOP20_06855 [Hyphomicrobiales bacterium]